MDSYNKHEVSFFNENQFNGYATFHLPLTTQTATPKATTPQASSQSELIKKVEEVRPSMGKVQLSEASQSSHSSPPLDLASVSGAKPPTLQASTHSTHVNERDKNGFTALMRAVEEGKEELVQELLDAHADTEIGVEEGYTPLMLAAYRGSTSIVQKLLQAGANVNRCDADGKTAVTQAILNGNEEIIRMVLDAGASVETYDRDGYSPLVMAFLTMKNAQQTNIVKLLIHALVNKNEEVANKHIKYALRLINRKFVAHVWGLEGVSKLKNPDGKEITFKLEGFPTNFTMFNLSKHAKEFFESKEFKSHPVSRLISEKAQAEIQAALEQAFPLTSESLDQILANIQSRESHPFVMLVGSEHHAISLALHQDQLIVCNRGEGKRTRGYRGFNTTTSYSLPSSDVTLTMLEKLTKTYPTTADFLHMIEELHLRLLPLKGFSQKSQEVGNCTWASGKGIFAALCMLYTNPTVGQEIYKAFTLFARKKAMIEYLDDVENLEPADMQLFEQMNEKYLKKHKELEKKYSGQHQLLGTLCEGFDRLTRLFPKR